MTGPTVIKNCVYAALNEFVPCHFYTAVTDLSRCYPWPQCSWFIRRWEHYLNVPFIPHSLSIVSHLVRLWNDYGCASSFLPLLWTPISALLQPIFIQASHYFIRWFLFLTDLTSTSAYCGAYSTRPYYNLQGRNVCSGVFYRMTKNMFRNGSQCEFGSFVCVCTGEGGNLELHFIFLL